MEPKSPLEYKPDYVVCVCMGVTHADIKAAIARGDRTFKQLQNNLLVGMGCSSCHAEVHQILDNHRDS